MYRAGFLVLVLGATTGWATVPYPASNFPYFGKIEVTNTQVQNATNVEALRTEAAQACRITHRALFALQNYFTEVRELIGANGANFPVLYKNARFYEKHLTNRYQACTGGKIRLRLHGRCGTERETVAFVKVTLGFVHSTINICDEYFADTTETRVGTLVHEYGRLENIGDSTSFDTNNIYVWDAIVGRLGDARTFAELSELKAKKKP
jgi:hypothetical protein